MKGTRRADARWGNFNKLKISFGGSKITLRQLDRNFCPNFDFMKRKKPAKQKSLVGRNWVEEEQGAATSIIGLAARHSREPFPLHALVGLRKPFVHDVDFELHH